MCGLAVALPAAAQTADLGEIVPGAEYEYEARKEITFTVTPAADGVIRASFSGDQIHAYSDPSHENAVEYNEFYWGANGAKVFVYDGKKDETLYFYNKMPLDGGKLKVTVGSEPIQLVDVDPSPTSAQKMSLSANYRLTVAFDMPVKYTKCTLEAGGQSAQMYVESSNATLTVNWFEQIMQWYADGVLGDGSELTVKFTGIRDVTDANNRYGENGGRLELKYAMAAKPAQVVASSGTPADGVKYFDSYYLPGGDDGVVSLTFDRALSEAGGLTAQILYGDLDNQDFDMYIERPPVSVDGNTVKVDLRGKSRLSRDMVPGLPAQPYIALTLTNVMDADGQYVWTGSMSSPRSFGFSYSFREVQYTVAADWTPLPGKLLKSGDDMEIWVLNGKYIAFNSVDFSYIKDGEYVTTSVPYSQLTVGDDPDDANARLFNLKVPEIKADADSKIKVTFGGLLCADGQDHSSDIEVSYSADGSGVMAIDEESGAGAIYDLHGRRMATPRLAPGIYVRDGKKFIIR